MADTPHVALHTEFPALFCVEMDYAKDSPNPSRVFRAMSDLIDALESIDHTLVEPLPVRIEPVLLLEDVETSSIKAWLAQKLETVDDDALKSGDYKKIVGSYLVRGKYAVINFLSKKTTIKSVADIEPLERELFQLAEEAYVSHLLPTYRPVSRQRLLNHVNSLSEALEPLTESDKVTYIDNMGRHADFNLSLSVAPETIDELLTRETIPSRLVMILKVKRPDFLGDAKWEFRFDNHPFLAKIAHDEWLADYRAGNVPLNPGDALKADVETIVKYGFEGDVIETQHTILEVLEVIRPPRHDQGTLNLEEKA